VGGKVEEQWTKGFVEKMSFQPEMENRRSNGMVTVVMKEMTN